MSPSDGRNGYAHQIFDKALSGTATVIGRHVTLPPSARHICTVKKEHNQSVKEITA